MGRILIVSDDLTSKLAEDILFVARSKIQSHETIICNDALSARRSFSDESIDEAWVLSCADMSVINLAVTLAQDRNDAHVYAVSKEDEADREILKRISGLEGVLPEREALKRLLERFDTCETFEPEEPNAEKWTIRSETINDASGTMDLAIEIEAHASKKSAFVISIMSGSGGVGKSAMVATFAFLAASKGFSVVVLDFDLQFGDMHQLMGDVPQISIDEMLTEESLFARFANSCNSDIPSLVRAPSRLERSEDLISHLDEVLDNCASLFDVVLVNTGSIWSEVNAQLIEKSTCNIFVLDQRASSIRSCKHAIDLCSRMGLATGQFVYALNRCSRGSLFNTIDVSNALEGANVVEVADGGQEVEELLALGLVRDLAASKNDFTNSLDAVLVEVLP